MLNWFISCLCLGLGTTVEGYLFIQKTYYTVSDIGHYNYYGDVSMFELLVPEMTLTVSWNFETGVSNVKCPPRSITIVMQHGSYPIPNPENNKTYPGDLYLHRTSSHTIQLQWNVTHKDLISPVAGHWFGIAFVPNEENNDVIQKITDLDCHYHILINATTIFLLNLPQIVHNTAKDIRFDNIGEYHIFRFYVEENIWRYNVIIEDCISDGKDTPCAVKLLAAGGALPNDENASILKCDKNTTTSCVLAVFSPVVPRWHYLMVKLIKDVKMNATVQVFMHGCSLLVNIPSHKVSKKSVPSGITGETVTAATSTDVTLTASVETTGEMVTTSSATKFPTTNATTETTTDVPETIPPLTLLDDDDDDICGPINMLYRIEDTDALEYAVYGLGPQSVTEVLVSSPHEVSLVQFNVLPMKDTGGMLSYKAVLSGYAFNPNHTQSVTVKMCFSPFHIPANNSQYYCPPGHATEVILDSDAKNGQVALLRVPYPEPGPYFLSIQSFCYVFENSSIGEPVKLYEPCVENFTQIVFQVLTAPCGNQTCGGRGDCRTYRKGSHVFSACRCYAKYRGITCDDDSQAESRSIQLLYTCFLSLSNLGFVPSIIIAVYRRYYVEAVVYFANMFFSGFYHACDMHPWSMYTLCIMPYHVLSYCDFLLSIISFWVTLIAMAELPPLVVNILHMLGVVALAMGVEWAQFSMVLYIVPISIGVVLVIVMWVLRSVQMGRCYPPKNRWFYIIGGTLPAVAGLVIFAFLQNDDNYPYTHSVWHLTIAISIVFLLPQREMQSCFGKDVDQSSDEFEFDDRNSVYQVNNDDSQLFDCN